jgi:dienelactone hydrolase
MQAQHTDAFRESVLSVLGAPPDPAPLSATVLETVELEKTRREKIRFQVTPNEWSFAYLFIPKNVDLPLPAIYVHHRRSDNWGVGKSEVAGLQGDKDHALAVELAERGYITFAPDAIGFEDRRAPESTGLDYDRAYNFHQLALRLMRGETLLKKVVWDVSRGVDFLESRGEVDKKRIGFTGHGYGGQMALWAAALEPRIRAAVASGDLASYKEVLKRGEWLQPELVVPRLVQVADVHHILSLIAPRPFLISAPETALQDAHAQEMFKKALPVYEKQGVGNRLTLYVHHGDIVSSRAARQRAYNWLDSWLMPY